MSDTARATIRFLMGICLWWLFVSPVFYGILSLPFLAASSIALLAWIVGHVLKKAAKILDFVFFAAILAMILFNQNKWLLSPILMGCIYGFSCAIICFLKKKNTQHHTYTRTDRPPQMPILLYLLGFFGIWAIGLLTTAVIPSAHAPIILMFWTCLMFVLFNEISMLATNALWVGYKTRRECFVSKRKWRIRFIIAASLLILWLGCSLWIFIG